MWGVGVGLGAIRGAGFCWRMAENDLLTNKQTIQSNNEVIGTKSGALRLFLVISEDQERDSVLFMQGKDLGDCNP